MRRSSHLTENREVILSNLSTTVTLGKWQGNSYIQGDRYTQVNFAENIRQLKMLRSFAATLIYRVTAIYRAIKI